MPETITRVIPRASSKKKTKPVVIKWNGAKMLRNQSINACVMIFLKTNTQHITGSTVVQYFMYMVNHVLNQHVILTLQLYGERIKDDDTIKFNDSEPMG